MLNFVNAIHKNIYEQKLIKGEKKLLIAFSGGQDSTCLVLILYLIQSHLQLVIGYVWLNHFWQTSSFFTMLHISRCSYSFCSKTIVCLPLYLVLSEESARDWRNSSMQRASVFYEYELCVQGHNKSDRIETVLFNLIRGAGRIGISALRWKWSFPVLSINQLYPTLAELLKQTHYCINTKHVFKMCLYQLYWRKEKERSAILPFSTQKKFVFYDDFRQANLYYHLKRVSLNE